jgi:hypothetical protein
MIFSITEQLYIADSVVTCYSVRSNANISKKSTAEMSVGFLYMLTEVVGEV